MTREQYNNHAEKVPGWWTASYWPRTKSLHVTVDNRKLGEAISYMTGYGFECTGATPSSLWKDEGTKLVFK
jgi:hypothetical protein